jgi:ferric-dicitrate binding protein FerR (iron transport regulator)
MQSQERFLTLLEKHTSNNISSGEHSELLYLISSGKYDQLIAEHFQARFREGDLPGTDIHPQRKQEIINKILVAEKQNSRILPGAFPKKNLFRWAAIAASVAGMIACAVYFLPKIYRNDPAALFARHLTRGMDEQANLSAHALKLKLEDGSSVTLQPGSRLHFPDHFSAAKREVYLEGEAFFEVSKNPVRPFFVYDNNLVTHVLGTSFNIKMDKQKKMVEVSVVTGKVQVYENQDLLKPDNKRNNGVILMPNQKVIYKEDERQFSATLVSNPLPVAQDSLSSIKPGNFAFEDAPLSTVLGSLEKTYGIEIVVENENIYHCLFTGNLVMRSLYDKLDIICQSVKVSYELSGTRILIKGKGCN